MVKNFVRVRRGFGREDGEGLDTVVVRESDGKVRARR